MHLVYESGYGTHPLVVAPAPGGSALHAWCAPCLKAQQRAADDARAAAAPSTPALFDI
jgi:hypothetical protein